MAWSEITELFTGLVLLDTITLYCAELGDTRTEIVAEGQQTVKHEIVHYFGISVERLEDVGAYGVETALKAVLRFSNLTKSTNWRF